MGMWTAYGINLHGWDIMPKSWTLKASVIFICSLLVCPESRSGDYLYGMTPTLST